MVWPFLVPVVRRQSSPAAHFQEHALQLLSDPPSSIPFSERSPSPCLSPRALASSRDTLDYRGQVEISGGRDLRASIGDGLLGAPSPSISDSCSLTA